LRFQAVASIEQIRRGNRDGTINWGYLAMNLELSRRQFLGTAGAGLAGTALGAFGFGEIEAAHAETIRSFKLVNTTETRNTCPYCSVACGIIMYSKGDLKKGEPAELIHIEGDTDHPTNRGTLCPKGAALHDFVKAPTRLKPHRAIDEGRPRRQFHCQEQ
jgi:formate dehydrogenase major subunit